jgi:hypothetical protein
MIDKVSIITILALLTCLQAKEIPIQIEYQHTLNYLIELAKAS